MFAGLLIAVSLLLGAVFMVHFYVDYQAESTRRDTNESLNVELALPTGAAGGHASQQDR